MAAKLIAYECDAADHQPSVLHADKLTVHEGGWAFCPFDARADGHHWCATGGIDLEDVTRRAGLSALAARSVGGTEMKAGREAKAAR